MLYLKIILYLIVAAVIATIVAWAGIFVILFTIIAAPIVAWWVKRSNSRYLKVIKKNNTQQKTADYKVVDAEYKIVDK